MSQQTEEPPIIAKLNKHLNFAEQRLLNNPRLTRAHIKTWHGMVTESLKKIYGPDAEVIRIFNAVADGAVLVSAPRVGLQHLMLFTSTVLDVLTNGVLSRTQQPQSTKGTTGLTKVFVGHGRNPIWSRVVNHLKEDLGVEAEAFETTTHTSEHIVDVLKGFLNICDAAVIVMTADDKTAEGTARARQNVIHEIGLFHGRHGFDRVILLQQAGTEDFSNVAGLQTVRFNERVEEGFYDLDRAIRKLQSQ